jgi:hypothetical protein
MYITAIYNRDDVQGAIDGNMSELYIWHHDTNVLEKAEFAPVGLWVWGVDHDGDNQKHIYLMLSLVSWKDFDPEKIDSVGLVMKDEELFTLELEVMPEAYAMYDFKELDNVPPDHKIEYFYIWVKLKDGRVFKSYYSGGSWGNLVY